MDQWISPAGLQGVVVLITAASSFLVYFRRRKLFSDRTKFNIYDDVRTSLEYLRQAKSNFPRLIKIFEEDSDSDSLDQMPFFSFRNSDRLSDIFNENADLLDRDEASAIAKFLDLGVGFEAMTADSKSEAFLRISKQRKLNFYALMLTEIGEMITVGDEITKKFEPMFRT